MCVLTMAFSPLAMTATLAQSTNAAETPNIVLILVDDLGKEWVSCYGAEDIKTPHIDKLAAEGMKFENAYSMPQCTPSRVSILTGQYPNRHGWVNHWDVPRWGARAHFDASKYPSIGNSSRAHNRINQLHQICARDQILAIERHDGMTHDK